MCHKSCIVFGASALSVDEIKGKRIIEVGSRDINGGLRPILKSWHPSEYLGVDIEEGPGVDTCCDVGALVERFGENSFHVVIATELMEHVRNWRKAVSNLKKVCKPNGIILLTTRSRGYGYHGYPYDFWRYEIGDMKTVFSDSEIIILENDRQAPGVMLKARKPQNFIETDLSTHTLYSIVLKKRVAEISDSDLRGRAFLALTIKETAKRVTFRIANILLQKTYPDQYFSNK